MSRSLGLLAGLLLALPFAGDASASGLPTLALSLDGDTICVDTTDVPPGVDPECQTVSPKELYEEVCSPIGLCVLQDVVTGAMDAQCDATGLYCDWRERTCLEDVLTCDLPLPERIEREIDWLTHIDILLTDM